MREQEEQEAEDEAEGLDDQNMPVRPPVGIPGLPVPTNGAPPSLIPGMGTIAPPSQPMPGMGGPNGQPPIDPGRLAGLFASTTQGTQPGFLPPPPPGSLPPGFDMSKLQLPPGFQFPAGLPPPPLPQFQAPSGGIPGMPGLNGATPAFGADTTANRRRAPLPSQQESLAAEQRRGNFRHAR